MEEKPYKLEIRPLARGEILEIARMHRELVGPDSARKITARLKKSLELLRTQPMMGVAVPDKELGQSGYRKLVCGHYLCFYRLMGDAVLIYHIADGRTEYKQLFRGEDEPAEQRKGNHAICPS